MMKLVCKYCKEEIVDKKKDSRKADGKRYHMWCLRKFRKEIDRQKYQGKIKPGQENKIKTGQ